MENDDRKKHLDQFLEAALRYQKENPPARLYGEELWFRGVTINLGAKRQILGIVKVLFEEQNRPVSLRQLMINLGEITDLEKCSDRLLRTYRQRILKSIQRSRHFLEASYKKYGLNQEWLPYNHKLGTWNLYGRQNPPPINRKRERANPSESTSHDPNESC